MRLIKILLLLGVVSLLYMLLEQPEDTPSEEPVEMVDILYTWNYESEQHSLSLALDRILYSYYDQMPGGIIKGDEINSYKAFSSFMQDESIGILISNKLSRRAGGYTNVPDRAAELAISFVRSLDYDTRKAAADFKRYRYPYQVLYDRKGICSEKTFLLLAILNELGYGTAIFLFEQEKHMGAGIRVPKAFSNFRSGYAFIETTAEIPVGILPQAISEDGRASEDGISFSGTHRIIPLHQGKEYYSIRDAAERASRLNRLETELSQLYRTIESIRNNIQIRSKTIDSLNKTGRRREYNNLIYEQKRDSERVRVLIEKYNDVATDYNRLIK